MVWDMFLVTVRVAGGAAATPEECSALRVETVAADPSGAVDYVYAQPSRDGMELVVFTVADAVDDAERAVRAAVEAAVVRIGNGDTEAHGDPDDPGGADETNERGNTERRVVEHCAVALIVSGAGAGLWPEP
jgi:hypothetical protein